MSKKKPPVDYSNVKPPTDYVQISYRLIGFTILGAILLWIAWGLFLNQWLGNTDIGSPFVKDSFKAQYWVYLQPENAKTKNYRVKADITRDDHIYTLDKVYWDNGGSSTFDDCKIEQSGVDGKYVSYGTCSSDELVNDEHRQYKVRLDTKVE